VVQVSYFSVLSLKAKILGLSLGSSLVVGLTALSLLSYLDHSLKEDEVKSYYTKARSFSDAIEAQFFERYGDIQAFALNPAFQDRRQRQMTEMLNSYSVGYGIYDLILYVDTKGKLLSVNDRGPDGKALKVKELFDRDYSREPWFEAVMNGKTTDDKKVNLAGTFVENPHFDSIVESVWGEKRYGSGFSAAVRNSSGQIIGVISNRAGMRWIGYDLKNFYDGEKAQGHASSSFSLIGPDGTLLMELNPSLNVGWKNEEVIFDPSNLKGQNWATSGHPAASALAKGETGSAIFPVNGEDYITGYERLDSAKFIASLGWGVIVKAKKSEAMANVIQTSRLFYGAQIMVLLAVFGLAWFFSTSLAKSIAQIIFSIKEQAENLAIVTRDISTSSVSLSESSTEQAAAIQQTAASVDEVSAMIKKNSDNAGESQRTSTSSRLAAEEGQKSVQEMISAIGQIQMANSEIMSQVDTGNREIGEIGEIVKVIGEIGNKTKVINDIVFQTKLLSFNASVEAARAGEHGKGFAVVAEEVGNLAQMSGNAAKEISTMLESSIRRVETIVTDTKSKVERLMQSGKATIENGTDTANRCGEALTNVLSTVREVDGMVAEIATASREQSTGVNEINKAMNQLDQTTQQNSMVAQKTATTAELMNRYSQDLNQMVQDLTAIVQGGGQEHGQAVAALSTAPKRSPKLSLVVNNPTPARAPEAKFAPAPLKRAVGADFVPSSDDPRFGSGE